MRCPICDEKMERGDCHEVLYRYERDGQDGLIQIAVTIPAAIYECSCRAAWKWKRGFGLELIQEPENIDLFTQLESGFHPEEID